MEGGGEGRLGVANEGCIEGTALREGEAVGPVGARVVGERVVAMEGTTVGVYDGLVVTAVSTCNFLRPASGLLSLSSCWSTI